jgi:hypothetical protein
MPADLGDDGRAALRISILFGNGNGQIQDEHAAADRRPLAPAGPINLHRNRFSGAIDGWPNRCFASLPVSVQYIVRIADGHSIFAHSQNKREIRSDRSLS